MKLFLGYNLLASADPLQEVDLQDIFRMIKSPERDFQMQINHLRMVKTLDEKQYSSLKRQLPYFVCGKFNPSFRRIANFAYTESFVVDIDHLSLKEYKLEELRLRLQSDPRVVFSFKSPGQDGLKLLFSLSERCYDAGRFSAFYKVFLQRFSDEYGLEQVIDSRTCDVTRACFLSVDNAAYVNENAESVNIAEYMNFENESEQLFMEHQADMWLEQKVEETKVPVLSEPDDDVLNYIKRTLSEKKKNIPVVAPPIVVPQVLEDIINDVKREIEKTGIVVNQILNIQYGKKIQVSLGVRKGEINLFYGSKHGFSVVQSPKRGTSPELNEVVADIITCFLALYNC